MIESQTVRVGEIRKIVISVKSTCRKAFEIENAKFSLKCGEEEESIQPQRAKARYLLRFTYDIGPESLIYECEIRTLGGD